jgi:hypothetical protein
MDTWFDEWVPVSNYYVGISNDNYGLSMETIIIEAPNDYDGLIRQIVVVFSSIAPAAAVVQYVSTGTGRVLTRAFIWTKRSFDPFYKVLQTENPLYFSCSGHGDLSQLPTTGSLEIEFWALQSSLEKFEPIGEGPVDLSA